MNPRKCEMCGAPLVGWKCEYCGTSYVPDDEIDYLHKELEKAKFAIISQQQMYAIISQAKIVKDSRKEMN